MARHLSMPWCDHGIPYPQKQYFPGPPEYVEQGFPMQPSYGAVIAPPHGIPQAQGHGMPVQTAQPTGGFAPAPYPPPNNMGYPPLPGGVYPPPAPMGYPPLPGAGYPPPPAMPHPYTIADGFYVDGERPMQPQLGGDPTFALDFLKNVSRLEIQQKIELLEIFTSFETPNKYTILNENKQPVFFAMEMSDCCARQCCGPQRPMHMQIVDLYQNEIIHLERPLRCQAFCFPCCLQLLEVSSPPGTIVSTIKQNWSIWPSFSVNDAEGETVLKIEGPLITSSCCCKDIQFNILSSRDGTSVGHITKKWTGFTQEYFVDADNFELTFHEDLDVNIKASLIGAVFLLDMMYYESSPNQNR